MVELHLIAHDIRSRENVGALFRVCDSLGVKKLWLTGYTPTPPNDKISKVALGAERSVSFEKVIDVLSVINQLKKEGIKIFALEQTTEAQELSNFLPPIKLAFVLGSERTGVPPSVLSVCDGAIQILQRGLKESLNVTIAAAIASWAILK